MCQGAKLPQAEIFLAFRRPTESAKFAVLTVSDNLCICDVSTKLNRISYTLLRIVGHKAVEEDGPSGDGGRSISAVVERLCDASCLSVFQ